MRAGRYWEDMDREVKVFLDKNGEKKEVDVEKRIERGKPRFLLIEKPTHPHEGRERKDAEQLNSAEEFPGVDEVPADQIQREQMMWLVEKVTSLEKENVENENEESKSSRHRPPFFSEHSRKMRRNRQQSRGRSGRLSSLSKGRQLSMRAHKGPSPAWRTK